MKSKITLFLVFMLHPILVLNAQVGIGTTNPDPSSVLDISSTDGGVLVPRMTEADKNAITTPAQGLMVYQTDATSGFYFFDGTWQLIGANDEDWTVSGNSMYATNANFVGIGDTTPSSKLSIISDVNADALSVESQYSVENTDANNTGGTLGPPNLIGGPFMDNIGQTFIAESNGSLTRAGFWVNYITNTGQINFAIRDSSGVVLYSQNVNVNTAYVGPILINIPFGAVPVVLGSEYQIYLTSSGQVRLQVTTSTNNNYPQGNRIPYLALEDLRFTTSVSTILYEQYLLVDNIGNIGIGTDAPSATLDVNGTFRLRDNGATDGAVLVSDANGNATWQSDVVALEAPIPVTSYAYPYANYNLGFQTSRYYKDRGRVYIEGMVQRAWPNFTGGEVIFTLPLGYRPSATIVATGFQGNDTLRIDISSNGEVRYISGANGTSNWVSLSGITFYAN